MALKKTLSVEQGRFIEGFFSAAYNDYLAALLSWLNGLLIQGATLANTSIEKYFKGMIAILGEPVPHHHNINANKIKNTIRNKYHGLAQNINFEFIEFLSKSYKLRYFDEVEDDYNLLISNLKSLAELDAVVSLIEESIEIIPSHIGESRRRYKMDKADKTPLLWHSNHVLNGTNKKLFVERTNMVHELRKVPHLGIMEVVYFTDLIRDDGKFLYDAFLPNENEANKYSVCFTPKQ